MLDELLEFEDYKDLNNTKRVSKKSLINTFSGGERILVTIARGYYKFSEDKNADESSKDQDSNESSGNQNPNDNRAFVKKVLKMWMGEKQTFTQEEKEEEKESISWLESQGLYQVFRTELENRVHETLNQDNTTPDKTNN